MLYKSLLSATLLACSSLISLVEAQLPPIEIVGNKFFYSNNGSQFYMKGVAYQQNTNETAANQAFRDPLADPAACRRDVPYLQQLQTNVIRVYALNVSLDHSECMDLLQKAGIYVIADLSEPDASIKRDNPFWDVDLLDRYTGVVDLFQNYTNILGFFAGNEVTNDKTNTNASAYVKAAVRDTKAYIKAKGYRSIPVGYSSNDDADIREAIADYFACGNVNERADFFGMNMYEWCGSSSFKESGYQTITELYKHLNIPLFFSEYGCNRVTPRKFEEVGTLYSSDMTDVWSGGIVYMYFQEENEYGLVDARKGKFSTLADFNNYKTQINKISPTYAKADSVKATTATLSCPTSAKNWGVSPALPPIPDEDICKCMEESLSCVVQNTVKPKDYTDLFAYICSQVDCSGINGNPNTGKYGAYSPCTSRQKLNFVMDLYYKSQGSVKGACSFQGSATLKSPKIGSSCSAVIQSAGSSGLGTVSGTIHTTKVANSTNPYKGANPELDPSVAASKKSGSEKQLPFDLVTKVLLIGGSLFFGVITLVF